MNRSKIYRVNLDVYKRQIAIVYTPEVAAYELRLLKKFPHLKEAGDPDTTNAAAVSLYNLDEYEIAWILLPRGSGVGLLSHEVVHIVDEIIRYFGLEGTETRAYLVQHIIEHIYN